MSWHMAGPPNIKEEEKPVTGGNAGTSGKKDPKVHKGKVSDRSRNFLRPANEVETPTRLRLFHRDGSDQGPISR